MIRRYSRKHRALSWENKSLDSFYKRNQTQLLGIEGNLEIELKEILNEYSECFKNFLYDIGWKYSENDSESEIRKQYLGELRNLRKQIDYILNRTENILKEQ